MKILFAVLMLGSFFFLLPSKKKDPGILGTVLNESDFHTVPVEKTPEIHRTVHEFNQTPYGVLEVRNHFAASGEQISSESFKEGVLYGEQKTFVKGKLRESKWIFGKKKNDFLRIVYDEKGEVADFLCRGTLRFTPEHDRVCGFNGPVTITFRFMGGRKETVMDQGKQLSEKIFFPDGKLWTSHKWNGEASEYEGYRQDGSIQQRVFSSKGKSENLRFNPVGKLIEKSIGRKVNEQYQENVIVFDAQEKEYAEWVVRKAGFNVKSCEQIRGPASDDAKPEICRHL